MGAVTLTERIRQALDVADYAAAKALLDQLNKAKSIDPEFDYFMGRLYGETGRVDLAVDHLGRYADLNLTCLIKAVNVLLQLHATDAALAILAMAIRKSPFDAKLRQLQIASYLEKGMLPEAVAAVSEKAKLCGLKPQDGKLFIEIHDRMLAANIGGDLLEQFMSHELVRQATAEVQPAGSVDPIGIWRAVEKLIRYGAYDAAQHMLDSALEQFSTDALVQRARIWLHFERGEYSSAAVAANQKCRDCGLDRDDIQLLSKLYSVIIDTGLRNVEVDDFLTNVFVQQTVVDTAKYSGFESLGRDCEFGVVQRKLGLEPLGLFRFSSVPFHTLIRLLKNDFRNFALPENCELRIVNIGDQAQYDLYDRAYDYQIHTFLVADTMADVAAILRKFCARVQFLKRKLLDDLASGEKIFVYKGGQCSDRDVRELSRVLCGHGSNRLLFVREFNQIQDSRPATLIRTGTSALSGFLDGFDVDVRQPSHLLEWQQLLDGTLREFAKYPTRVSLMSRFARVVLRVRRLCMRVLEWP